MKACTAVLFLRSPFWLPNPLEVAWDSAARLSQVCQLPGLLTALLCSVLRCNKYILIEQARPYRRTWQTFRMGSHANEEHNAFEPWSLPGWALAG